MKGKQREIWWYFEGNLTKMANWKEGEKQRKKAKQMSDRLVRNYLGGKTG